MVRAFCLPPVVYTRSFYSVGAHNKIGKREEVLAQGLRLMYDQGYNGTGVKEIVDAAGIPKGSFYTYFESKEDLLLEALKQYSWASEIRARETLTATGVPPLTRIQNYFDDLIAAHLDGQCRQGCFVTNVCHELAATHAGIGAAVGEHIDCIRDLLAACLDEARAAGAIQIDCDAGELAEFIQNSWDGALTRSKARRSREPLENFKRTLFQKIL